MRWIVTSSLKFRFLLVPLAAALVVLGVVQAKKMSVDALPEFTPTTVEVQTEALGLSAKEVEQLITTPLEQDLLVGLPFLDTIESASLPGLSSVVMTFEKGTPLLDARQVVQERLTQAVGVAGLPAVAKPPQMIQPVSSTRRVSMIKLSSDTIKPIDVSVLARWVISPRLMGVPGVANVSVWGFRDRQLQVLVDPEQLRKDKVTLAQVIETSGNALEVSGLSFLEASKPGTGGFIDTANQRLNIFHEQAISDAEELAQVPLDPAAGSTQAPGTPRKTLGDVTKVVENHQPLIGDAICPDGGQCLYLVVEKFPGANTVEVTKNVDAALDGMQAGLGDMRIDTSLYRPATFIESSFANLGWVLLVGGFLLLLVIGIFLWDWRRSLIVAAVIPVSVAAAVLVLDMRGTTINLMIVAGLVLGLTAVIQDVVADVQNIARRARSDRDRDREPAPSRWDIVVQAFTETRRAGLYAALIVAAAALPLLFLPGEAGAFLPAIVLSYLLAVAASMVVAIVLTPALALLLLAGAPLTSAGPPGTGRSRQAYERLAPRLVTRTGAAFGIVTALAIIGLLAVPFLDTSLKPGLKERDVLVHIEAAPGTSLPKMTQITRQAVKDLGSVSGVVSVGGQVGRAVMSDQIVNVNSGEIWVKVADNADYDKAVAAIGNKVRGYADVTTDVLTYSDERVTDILGRADDDVVVRLYGENPDVLTKKAAEVRKLVSGVDGVARANVQSSLDEPTVEVQVDLAKAQAAGVKPGDVRRAAATLLGGMTVGNLFDQQKVFDVVVWGAPEIRTSESNIKNLLVDTPSGGHVRIGDVADVQIKPNPTLIRHESVSSYLDVTASVAGRDVRATAEEINSVVKGVQFPLEHHAEVLGGHDEARANQGTLLGIGLAALITIFLLLQAAFRSWRLAIMSFVILPVALVGGVVAALITGATVTLGTVAGLVAVLGIAARGVVLVIRRYQDLEHTEGVTFGASLIVRGTRETISSTITAAVATAVVFAPIAVAGRLAGLEILQPMAVVVLGGLVTTTLLTLFVTPALYLRFGSNSEHDASTDELFTVLDEQQHPAETAIAGAPPNGKAGAGAVVQPVQQRIQQRIGRRFRLAFTLVPLALLATACGGTIADKYVIEGEPAHAEPIAGTDHVKVTMTEQAARRIGLETTAVQKTAKGLAVPASATFVDPEGHWWVYTNPEPLVYVRQGIAVQREEGDLRYFTSGPAAGTKVVTVGVQEIHGVEDAVGH